MDRTDQIEIRQTDRGAALAVKLVPGSSRDRIVGVLGDCLKIATAAAPQAGKANAAATRIIAGALGVDRKDVELLRGRTSPRKEFLIRGKTAEQLRDLLAAI